MRKYWYISKMSILTLLSYRFEVITALFINIILLIANVYLWRAAYHDSVIQMDVRIEQMVTYAIVSVILSAIFQCNVQEKVNRQIREGMIAMDLIKPINIFGGYLAEDIGSSIGTIINRVISLIIFAMIFFDFSIFIEFKRFLIFCLSCILSYLILWIINAMVGLLAFWFIDIQNIAVIKDVIVRVLSGSIVPIWFFPKWFQKTSFYLPFQYIYQTPIEIYIGKLSIIQALNIMGIQLVWCILLILAFQLLWSKMKSKLLIQGG